MRHRKICAQCKSEEIAVDAWAEWNPERQCFELLSAFDAAYCMHCDEPCDVDEVEITDAEYNQMVDDRVNNTIEVARWMRAFGKDEESLSASDKRQLASFIYHTSPDQAAERFARMHEEIVAAFKPKE